MSESSAPRPEECLEESEKTVQRIFLSPQLFAGAGLAPVRPSPQKYFEQNRVLSYLLSWVAAKISLFV
jgi:hypothetical protein